MEHVAIAAAHRHDHVNPADLVLSVKMAGAPRSHRIAIAVDRSLITPHCAVSDIEIAAFAVHASLQPWISSPAPARTPRLHTRPLASEIIRAISAFSHSGPIFEARLGAVRAAEAYANDGAGSFSPADASLTMSLPDGVQSILDNQLLSPSIRDHWLAHRHATVPAGALAMKREHGLPILKISIAAMMSTIVLDAPGSPEASVDPEVYWYATRRLLPALGQCWPRTPRDSWNAVHLGETLAIAMGWVREDPAHPDGFKWRQGPRWKEALADVPPGVLAVAAEILRLASNARDEWIDAACAVIAEEIGPEYGATFRAAETIEHTGHAQMGAAPLIDKLDVISRQISVNPRLACWLTTPWQIRI